jgi:uncharacterized protein with PIN domain
MSSGNPDPPPRFEGEPRYFADAMLGSLARWLRAAGLDVLYEADIEDAELVERAAAEGRTILTRDRRLVERRLARDHLLIASDDVDEQLRQVLDMLDLERLALRPFGRCLECNERLAAMSRAEASSRVPAYVARTCSEFRYCAGCDRIFWRATHVAGMEARLKDLGVERQTDGGAPGRRDGVD